MIWLFIYTNLHKLWQRLHGSSISAVSKVEVEAVKVVMVDKWCHLHTKNMMLMEKYSRRGRMMDKRIWSHLVLLVKYRADLWLPVWFEKESWECLFCGGLGDISVKSACRL